MNGPDTTRLTDHQIRQTVAAMRTADHLKSALLTQALSGDSGARFVIYGAYLRQTARRGTVTK